MAAAGDGGFNLGDAGHGPLGVVEASPAPVELTGAAGSLVLKTLQVAPVGLDAALGVVDGESVRPAEPAGPGERLEAGLGGDQALPRGGDGPI